MGEQRELKAEITLLYENSGALFPLEAQGDIPATAKGPLQFIAKAKRLRACSHHLPKIIERHRGPGDTPHSCRAEPAGCG